MKFRSTQIFVIRIEFERLSLKQFFYGCVVIITVKVYTND